MRFARVFGILFGLHVVGLCLLFGMVRGERSGAGWIVFVREDQPGHSNLYTMDANGGRVRSVTDVEGRKAGPTWSPDGEWIAFVAYPSYQADIYKIRVDGTGLTRLTDNLVDDETPEWSPNGRWIAFASGGAIYVMGSEGGEVRRVTPTAVIAAWPTWSPNSQGLMFRGISNTDYGLFWIRMDGTDMRLVVNDWTSASSLEWSPRGERIALSTFSSQQIYVGAAQGTGPFRLVATASALQRDPAWSPAPTWSPDGEWLVYTSENGAGNTDLYKVRVDGRDVQRLTWGVVNVQQPEWGKPIDLAWSGWLVGMMGMGIGAIGVIAGTKGRSGAFKA